ncbi:EsV-1-163 [Ectocarpus siliculosus]|uniref:EsV-1-163 n=1 Tax=Ectocarpus siliculosus TaxID=2880 RepID=D8LI46_ECTSI|nr:EsV-1-163 [Ectocarpus siliculosus]|eukprot:CBN79382.1 EsV-1-163 [Ectocarpus siliculosus]
MLGAASALEVVTPAEGDIVVASRAYTVEWTGTGSNNRYEIDLYYCGSMCMEDECGDWVTALCPYGEDGCPDNEGDYDIVMPEPMSGTSGSGYKVRVADVDDDDSGDCSDEFYLMAHAEAPSAGDAGGPYVTVTSPSSGDSAEAGEEYTVEFDYDNGLGSSVGRFAIDLYSATGSGDCGTFMYTLCDKPTIGCKDSMGDYDVEIPEDAEAGMYTIRVGDFEDDSVYGCSDEFEILGADDSPDDGDLDMESEDADSSDDDSSDDDSSDDDSSMSYRF